MYSGCSGGGGQWLNIYKHLKRGEKDAVDMS